MKKRVLISVTNDIAYDNRMQKTAKTLSQNGFAVNIVGRLKESSSALDFNYFSSHRFHLFFKKGKLFYLEYNLRLFFYLLSSKSDIFCAVDLDTILPNVLVGKLKGIPIIYDAHEYFTEVPELANRKFEKTIWKIIEKISLPFINRMYTVSDGIAEIFQKEYAIHPSLIYNFPFELREKINTPKENIIVYQGDLNEGRGLDIAIKAMEQIEDYKLHIIGDGYDGLNLKQMTKDLGLESRVLFLGALSPEDLKVYNQKAKFGLNLLENKGLNYYHSLANKYFDYIQSSIIPITMRFPEYKRFQQDYNCAILVESLSVKDFLEVLLPILRDEIKYAELVKNCDIAQSFLSWERQEDKLCSIYNNV